MHPKEIQRRERQLSAHVRQPVRGALAAGLATAAWLILAAGAGAGPAADGKIFLPLLLAEPDSDVTGTRPSHAGWFSVYEGSKTCQGCHTGELSAVHASLHYQWQGDTPYVPNLDRGGKLGGINDFCVYPDINWLGMMMNLDAQQVDGGCATCHVGLGAKPERVATIEQLQNIDCLVCHSETYKRKLEPLPAGGFRFVPAPEKMTVPLLQAITDIGRPTKAACLSCHAYSGGGANNKRGDLEPAHADPPSKEFDVHMASRSKGGAGLDCVSCHTTEDHRIAGRGSDMRATDLDVAVRCSNCHTTQPHDNSRLDRHAQRVDCAVCHVPAFARIQSTDMVREFDRAEVDRVKRLFEPAITRQANVTPEYRFFNGYSTFYEFGAEAVPGQDGRVAMSEPMGSRSDPDAKLYAFKRHEALQAHDPATGRLIPLKMGLLFQHGDPNEAILAGAAAVNWILPQGYDFIATERWMSINHEVAPASQALTCDSCHNGGTRVDFDALGYTPKATRNGRPLCASCHEDESGEWDPSELFTRVHAKHVDDKHISCSECHNF